MIGMLSIGSFVYGLFSPLGIAGLLAALFVIFYFDSTIIPMVPELFTVIIFMAHPSTLFGILMVLTLSAGEFSGLTTLYLVVRRFRLPARIRNRIQQYSKFLLIPDEKMILLNRIAPVIPFLGAFIATCDWPYGKSVAFNFTGGLIKYSLIIALASYVLVVFSSSLTAELITIVAILALMGLSYSLSVIRRRSIAGRNTGGPS